MDGVGGVFRGTGGRASRGGRVDFRGGFLARSGRLKQGAFFVAEGVARASSDGTGGDQ